MSRVQSREELFKLIFEFCLTGEKNEFSLETVINENENLDEEYIKRVYNGIVENYKQLEEEISKYAKGFSVERIFKVDLALLYLALYEIKFIKEIPNVVSVNEVLNLAKTYSTEKSASYINGVLSNFVKK